MNKGFGYFRNNNGESGERLAPYISPLGAWAMALGTSIGWGSLFVTSNTYLPKAGPLGTVFGLLIGMLIMLIISRNYHYMINCFPEAGGAYTYAKEIYGYDHFGHKAGDDYIRSACKMICDVFRHSPVFRIGGDEFAVILNGRDYENRFELMKTLDHMSEEHIGTDNVVVAAGMADYLYEENETFMFVMSRADKAMYERKQQLKEMSKI